MLNPTMLRPFAWALKTRFLYKKSGPGISHVQCHSAVVESTSHFTLHRFLTCCSQRQNQNEIFITSLLAFASAGGCKKNNNNIYSNNDILIINIALRRCKFLILY